MVETAIAVDETAATATRGRNRIDPAKCLRPEVNSRARRLYSFAEAVDAQGNPQLHDDKAVAGSGTIMPCTREVEFELSDHKNCVGRGLNLSGFVVVDLTPTGATTVRFSK